MVEWGISGLAFEESLGRALRKRRPLRICDGNRGTDAAFRWQTLHYVSNMNDHDERQLIEELDREVSRKGSLFALIACLAIATGLAVAAAVAMVPTP